MSRQVSAHASQPSATICDSNRYRRTEPTTTHVGTDKTHTKARAVPGNNALKLAGCHKMCCFYPKMGENSTRSNTIKIRFQELWQCIFLCVRIVYYAIISNLGKSDAFGQVPATSPASRQAEFQKGIDQQLQETHRWEQELVSGTCKTHYRQERLRKFGSFLTGYTDYTFR